MATVDSPECSFMKIEMPLEALKCLAECTTDEANIVQFTDPWGNQGNISVTKDKVFKICIPQYTPKVLPGMFIEPPPESPSPVKGRKLRQKPRRSKVERVQKMETESKPVSTFGIDLDTQVSHDQRHLMDPPPGYIETVTIEAQGEKTLLPDIQRNDPYRKGKGGGKPLCVKWDTDDDVRTALNLVSLTGASFDDIFMVKKDRRLAPAYYVCQVCGSRLGTRSGATAHWTKEHPNTLPYGCPACKVRGLTKMVLYRHMLNHSNHYPCTCEICGKSFRSKGKLNEHRVFHSDDRRYECGLCEWRFHCSSALKKHLVKIHGRKSGPGKPGKPRRQANKSPKKTPPSPPPPPSDPTSARMLSFDDVISVQDLVKHIGGNTIVEEHHQHGEGVGGGGAYETVVLCIPEDGEGAEGSVSVSVPHHHVTYGGPEHLVPTTTSISHLM